MRKWLFLASAIVAEVAATMALRASVDSAAWIVLVVAGYAAAFVLLALTLRAGAAIGVAYGIWGACGVALVALLGAVLFGEALTWTQVAGIVVIIAGVAVVETGSAQAEADAPAAGEAR